MNILFFGDIFAKSGRKALLQRLPALKKAHHADFVVANGENMAGGLGIDLKRVGDVLSGGVDVLTTGNHVWSVKGTPEFLQREPRVLRPANYPEPCPGRGWAIRTTATGKTVAVINLMGRLFMDPVQCPFETAERLLAEISPMTRTILVDFHAEATSEKLALAQFLQGKVTALVGTHTHVQTADERIFSNHTGYISDLGMCGPLDSVIGMDPSPVLERFRTWRRTPFRPAKGPVELRGVVLDVDPETGRTHSIERIKETVE